MSKPTEIRLTEAEANEFEDLEPVYGVAWNFWKRVGNRLKIDFKQPMRLMQLDRYNFAVL